MLYDEVLLGYAAWLTISLNVLNKVSSYQSASHNYYIVTIHVHFESRVYGIQLHKDFIASNGSLYIQPNTETIFSKVFGSISKNSNYAMILAKVYITQRTGSTIFLSNTLCV